LIDRGNAQAKRLGYDLRRAAKAIFHHWTDYRGGAISWAAVQRRLAPVRREVERLLRRGLASGNRQVQGTCRELYEHRGWLRTFARCRGVEPTNNASERALRHAVIWRKLSFGAQSAGGSRFVETMLTVIETCRQQGRHLLSFVTAAVQSHLARQSAPSLLPGV
jgi:transposase